MEALDPQLRELIEAHKSFFRLTDNGKIECTLNGHTLPARLDAVSSFIKGAKFQKLSRRQTADQALQKYEPFIVQSDNFPLMLYCALTGQLIDKSVEAVKKHMKGKKFQRAKDRFAADDLELKPEPTLESFGIKTSKGAAANQQQQQSQQQEEEGSAAAGLAGNGAAPGSEEEPGFWVPEGAESGSSSGGESEEEGDGDADGAKPGSSGSSSSGDGDGSDADAADADMETGPAGDSGDDPMEEDPKPAAAAAAKGSKAGSSKGSSEGGARVQQKQKQQASKGKGAAQNGAAASGATKKRNAQRPSAAKKARR